MSPSAESARRCPSCDGRESTLLHRQRFALPDGHPMAAGYDVRICSACSTGFADPIPDQSVFDRYYATLSKYTDGAAATGGGSEEWDARRLRELADFLAATMPDRSARILDVGCANGGLLRALRAMGYRELMGVDPSAASVMATARIDGVRALQSSLFDIPEHAGDCDLLILSHVLEHVRDVRLALRVLAARLAPGGRVYIEVPDASRYVAHLVAPFLEFNTEHINHFSEQTLQTLILQLGWEVEGSGTKLAPSSPTTMYPCAWILASPGARRSLPTITRDYALATSLGDYMKRSGVALAAISSHCDRVGIPGLECALWGTGQTAAILLAQSTLSRARFRFFTDSNLRFLGHRIAGAPVVPAAQLHEYPALPVIVGTILHEASVRDTVRSLGLSNPLISLNPANG